MDRYCSSTFWDPSITWNTTDPDFTDCFEKTVLLWTACAFLWITAIFDIYMLADPSRGASALGHDLVTWQSAWTWLSILKLFNITVLICLEVSVLCINWYENSDNKDVNIFAVPDVLWTTPLILIATHAVVFALFQFLSACLIYLHKTRCVHTSGIQLLHWLMLSLVHAIIFRTEYKIYEEADPNFPKISITSLVILGISLAFMLLQSFVFCWADIPRTDGNDNNYTPLIQCTDGIEREECPMIRCSCLSYVLFSWCTPIVRKGYKQPLTSGDLWDLIKSLTTPVVFKLFEKSYGKRSIDESRSIYRNILKPLWDTCGWALLVALICKQVGTLMAFLSPKIMGFLIDFVEDKQTETWKGYLWAVLLFLIYVVITLFWEQFYLHIFKCYVNVLTCLNLIIYKKSMNVSSEARKKTTTGEIVNLMSVDVEAIRIFVYQGDALWSSPVQVAVGVTLLWNELGYAVLPGLAVIFAVIPINWFLSAKISTYQRDQMKVKDERIKVLSEVLGGIQAVKLYAWEPSFLLQIKNIRKEEIEILKKRAFCQCVMQFVLDSVPFMVSIAAFFTFVYLNGEESFNPKKAFTAVTLFSLLTDPIQDFPQCISALVDARVSCKRVNDFLNSEENHPEATKFLPKDEFMEKPAVEIVNGTFAWEEISQSSWMLSEINLSIVAGSLTAVVGEVASGKSSLLSAILGDMKHSGQVTVRGNVAYVPQVAWILNATLRENICFGLPYNKEKYDEVLECCCLGADIEMLPAGDMTEIGEKGINLSGGQKQRVSLARAAYSGSDVLLLDDVLSAVDTHVGKHIFDRLLGPSGILKNKTRILCTHSYQYLSQVDYVVMLDGGRIVESGSYDELMLRSEHFADLISTHIQSKKIEEASINKSRGTSTSTAQDDEEDTSRMKQGKLIEEERLETGDVKLAIFMKYLKALGYFLGLAFVICFGCAEGLSVGRNVMLSKWTSAASHQNGTDGHQIKLYALGYGLLGLFQSLFYLIGYFLLAIATLSATQLLHNRMLKRILHAPMSFFNVTLLGRITNRFSSDVEGLDKKLPSQIGDWICHIYKFLGVMAAIIFATNVYFVVYMIPLTILYYFLQRYYILCMQQLQRIMNALRSPIYAQFQETLNGTSTIRAYKAEDRFCRLLGEKIDNYNRANFPHLVVRRWLSIRLGILGSTVVFIPALFAVIWRDQMDPSLVGLSISYAVQVTSIISWLVKVTSYLQYNFVSVERIIEYSEINQEQDFDKGKSDCPPNWPENGAMQFINYSTRYRPGLELVLKHFTCLISPGEKIGVVGRTGAGKSSLTLAIFRIVEAVEGEIRIDGLNIADLGLHQVRKRLTVIPQDPILFSRSLRLNLDPFGEYNDDKIWKALEMAHLRKYVDSLEAGLDYLVAEGGENLSVGQRQLLCLARAILRKSTILILDEATASVDSVTDELIQKTIKEHFAECTILNVAHRLNTVLDSTRILVLHCGEIVEFDTPQNLLTKSDSYFYRMARDAGIVTNS